MWFELLTGFKEKSPEYVRDNLSFNNGELISKANGRRYQAGNLEVPSLDELKTRINSRQLVGGKILVSEIIGDVRNLHSRTENEGALFQAASQFNLLEMVGPHITPEDGVDIYELDQTQGPACAISCGAGTIFRNYLVPLKGQIGQSTDLQIDCLDLIGSRLENTKHNLWDMINGYALVNQTGILHLNSVLSNFSPSDYEALKGALRIGVQWNTEVTINGCSHLVTQAYCSALPVSYSNLESAYWKRFATLILEATYEATYEATLYSSLINFSNTGCNKVFLTLVGGGAFGNDIDWILEAIDKSLYKFKEVPLDIVFVSYHSNNPGLNEIIKKYR